MVNIIIFFKKLFYLYHSLTHPLSYTGVKKEKNMIKYILIWALFCYIESKIEDYLNDQDAKKKGAGNHQA
jgi:hypothetical protein